VNSKTPYGQPCVAQLLHGVTEGRGKRRRRKNARRNRKMKNSLGLQTDRPGFLKPGKKWTTREARRKKR